MPRFLLTSLGVLALLFCAPDEGAAAELVRVGITPSSSLAQVGVLAQGAAPRDDRWTEVASGPYLGIGLHSRRAGAPVSPILDASPAVSAENGRADHSRALPDARAPPA